MADYSKMWKIMHKYKFKFDLELTGVKCAICNDLLIDARRGLCGCLYCQACMSIFVRDGVKSCPTVNGSCKYQDFGALCPEISTTSDDLANRRVSTLTCECPFDNCDYSCALIGMDDHLRVCDKREIGCPYGEIGCDVSAIATEGLASHLEEGAHEHSVMMGEWLKNTKNEIAALLHSGASKAASRDDQLRIVNAKIDKLLTDSAVEDRRKQKLIEDLKKEVGKVKNKNKEFDKFIKKTQSEMEEKDKEIGQLKECCKELAQLKESVKNVCQANEQLKSRMEKMQKTFMIDENEESLDELAESGSRLYRDSSESRDRISSLPIVYLEWEIADVQKLRRNRARIWSEEFFSINGVYKMRLLFDSFGSHDGSQISIRLFIYDGIGARSAWPFEGIATVAVENRDARHCSKSLSRRVQIDKAADLLNDPQFFYFSFSELHHAGVFGNDAIIIDWKVNVADQ